MNNKISKLFFQQELLISKEAFVGNKIKENDISTKYIKIFFIRHFYNKLF